MQQFLTAENNTFTQALEYSFHHNSEICWSQPWDIQRGAFKSCFLPVLEALPALITLIIILLHICTTAIRWRPRWTQPFVQEYSQEKLNDITQALPQRPSIHLLVLSILTASTTALQIARAILNSPKTLPLLLTGTWVLILALILVQRPRTPPYGILLILVASMLINAALLARSYDQHGASQVIDIVTVIFTITSVVVILLMPLRNPGLSDKDISTPGSAPSSILRSPEDNLALWQFMTVSWMAPLITIGKQRQLEDEDVWQLGYEFQHKRLHEQFRLLRGTVISRLVQANAIDLFIISFLGLLETSADYAVPVVLQRLLASMRDESAPIRTSINYAGIMLVIRLISTQSGVFSLWFGRRCYERSRGEMVTMLYEKTLGRKISLQSPKDESGSDSGSSEDNGKPESSQGLASRALSWLSSLFKKHKRMEDKKPASMGKILNLMRGDVYEVAQRFWEVQDLITIPLSIIYSTVLVVQFLGPASLIAITVIVIAQIVNTGLARILVIVQQKMRQAVDERLEIVGQFVASIRHLRWYGWQDSWLTHIMTARQHELNWRIITSLWMLLFDFVNALGMELAPAVGFYAYTVISGGALTVDVGFPALTLMFMLTSSLRDIPSLVTALINAWVAVSRIEDFMAEADKEEMTTADESDTLALRNASFAWPGATTVVLSNISMSFPQGLTVISGEVAAGKTALLQALLGELDMLSGQLYKPDAAIGYCSQTPWLQSMSIRENILFSAPFDEKRYADVLRACALLPDLAEIPAGDQSFIGENGIGLSGGQKARVALARAAYSDSKILFLDDPLSALDQQTAEHIVRELFLGGLFTSRTVVLVTHRLDLVAAHGNQFYEIKDGQANRLERADLTGDELYQTISKQSTKDTAQAEQKQGQAPAKFIEDEYRAKGGVKLHVYWDYIKAGKLYWWFTMILVLVAYRLITVFQTWFLKEWGEAYSTESVLQILLHSTNDDVTPQWSIMHDFPPPDEDVKPWILVMFLIGLGRVLLNAAMDGMIMVVTYVAGKEMFRNIIYTVGHATFRFYDVTPVGRLMNRMTSDISVIDGGISRQFSSISWLLLAWLSSIFIVAFVTPTFLAFTVVLTCMFVYIFRWFLPASQSLRRLEMVSLTPLMSNFGELLNGLVTVRAFCAQSRFQDRVIRVVDNFQKMDHFYWSLQAWLMYRYDILSAFSAFFLTLLALVTNVSPGLTAFVLLAANKFIKTTHSLCRQYGQLQMEFVSVERIIELAHLEQEPVGDIQPPAWWPSFTGGVEFKDVVIKYAPHLEPALAGVSFKIKAGSKTAILGRTGSGKSTMALALLATIVPTEGQIIVDNIDLAKIDKQTLRTRVTFLAQDPVLFPGTMRQNLDPLEQHTAEDCEAVLARVCERQGWALDTRIEGGGSNLSQGQRQLVGLARAVLRRSAIIILDEATASIDLETSMQIQQVLHEEMKESTVITIAHRLEAVSNADYCIVLGKGKVVRQGPAAELLAERAGKANDIDETND